ncbi:CoA pyrophosphatase [Streptomyces sp. NBC_00365]|uniref:NUDIX hydrolase n=1 Tax=Streptomyces sp. NBC_00365 TaxID=2975726 RepID=UPI002B1E7730|nr:CoA pyrophosphatase [Streptomyces sp. NBC_00365]
MTHASNTHNRHDEPETHHTQNETGTHRTQNEPGTHRTRNEPGTHHTYDGPGAHHRTQEDADSHNGRVLVTKDGLPPWLDPVVHAVETVEPLQLSRFLPPADGAGRQSAVLILFGEGARGPELLLMERASSLRSHAGQPSFPGGALDPEDGDPMADGPLQAALREAEEETGLDPSGVQLFGVLPKLYIPVSSFVVTPVLGWWREPTPVGVVDPAETARVFTVPVADLTDPAHRATTVHPSGHRGPAFLVESALVWGFTAGIIDRLLHYAGWELPWDREKQVPLDWRA